MECKHRKYEVTDVTVKKDIEDTTMATFTCLGCGKVVARKCKGTLEDLLFNFEKEVQDGNILTK
jgi:predicted RNA-binding Zn-ribbon protein involved in translation (DUF1610 family)